MVKNAFDQMTAIKGYDDEARSSDAGSFHNPFAACVAEDDLMSRLFCPAKAHKVGLDRNIRSLCGLEHERNWTAHASAATQNNVIVEILAFLADGSLFGVCFEAMGCSANDFRKPRTRLNKHWA
jgi:hypothetical protein